MRTAAIVVALACAGCVALTARAQVGVVTSEFGSGVQAGVTLGYGMPTSHDGAVLLGLGVDGGAPRLGINDSIDYVHLPAPDAPVKIEWRAGLGTLLALHGDPSLIGPEFAMLVVLRDRPSRSWGSEGVGNHASDRSVLALGIEGRLGAATPGEDSPLRDRRAAGFGGSALLTLEWLSLYWWSP